MATLSDRPVLQINRWNSNFCECGDDPNACLDVCCCWHAQMTAQLNKLYYNGKGPMICCCLCYVCLDAWFLGIPTCICVAVTRSGVRNRYMLDCSNMECCAEFLLYTYCCWCCMQCQNHREMHMRGDYPGGCCTEENPRFIRARPAPTMGYPQNIVYTTTVITAPTVATVVQPQYPQAPGYGPPPPHVLQVPPQYSQQPYPYTPSSATCPPANSGFNQYPYSNNNNNVYPGNGTQPYPQQGYPQQQQPQQGYPLQPQPAFANNSAPYASAPVVGLPMAQGQQDGCGQPTPPQVQFYNNSEY